MKRVDEVIQGNEDGLRNRIIMNLLNEPYLLRQFEEFERKTGDLTNHLEEITKILMRSQFFYV
jgi:hypothetical protein